MKRFSKTIESISFLKKRYQRFKHSSPEKYKLGKTLAKYVFLSLAMGCIIAFLIAASKN